MWSTTISFPYPPPSPFPFPPKLIETIPGLQILQLRLPSLPPFKILILLHQNPSSEIFIPAEDPTLLYTLSPWPSTFHPDFLASPRIEPIFSGPTTTGVEFVRSLHIGLPSTLPTVSASESTTINTMTDIPVFKAPILMVASLYATSAELENITNEGRLAMLKACDQYGVVDGWRVDAEEGSWSLSSLMAGRV